MVQLRMDFKFDTNRVSSQLLRFIKHLGRGLLLLFAIARVVPHLFVKPNCVVDYIYKVGVRLLSANIIVAAIVGIVSGVQIEMLIDSKLSIESGEAYFLHLVIQEFAPLITALLFVVWIAHLIDETITNNSVADDRFEANPWSGPIIEEVVAPMFAAGLMVLPLLLCIFDVIALLVHDLISIYFQAMNTVLINAVSHGQMDFYKHIMPGLIKSVFFAFILGLMLFDFALKRDRDTPASKKIGLKRVKFLMTVFIVAVSLDLVLSIVFFKSF